MVYAEFHHLSTGWNETDFSGPKELIPCCGSDGVFILDGRNSRGKQIADARARGAMLNKNLGKKIEGFIIHRGESFTNSKPVGGFVAL